MNTPDNIIEVTEATFNAVVVDASRRVPVLVDYWADWCGPCKMQMPVLVKLAGELGGRFLVAKVNTDLERELAAQQGIRSLPTLHLYRDGEVVDEALGAQTETALRAMLEPWLERESDQALARAIELIEQGKADAALAELRAGCEADPGNHRLAIEYARLAIQLAQFDTARAVIDGLPREARDKPEVAGLATLLEFAVLAGQSPPIEALETQLKNRADDRDARLQLAARQALAGDLVPAIDNLLEIMRAKPDFADGTARRGLLGLFELLDDDQLAAHYRRKLAMLLH